MWIEKGERAESEESRVKGVIAEVRVSGYMAGL